MVSLGIKIMKDKWSVAAMKKTRFSIKFVGCCSVSGASVKDRLDALVDLMSEEELRSSSITIGLPRDFFVSRMLTIPAPTEGAIENIIRFEVEKHIPFQIDEAYYDYQVFGRNDGQYSVMITAVRKSKLDDILESFKDNNIEFICADTGQRSVFNALEYFGELPENKSFMFIEVDEEFVSVDTYIDGAPVDSRVTKVDGRSLNECIKDIKSTLKSALLAAGSSEDSKKPESVVLVCEDSVSEEFTTEVRSITGLSVKRINLSESDISSNFISAAGLALSGLGKGTLNSSLLPPSLVNNRKTGKSRVMTVAVAAAILWLLVGASFLVRDLVAVRKLDSTLSVLKGETDNMRRLSEELRVIDKRRRILEAADGKLISGPLDVLKELSYLLPANTWLIDFDYKDGTIYLEGLSGQASSLLLRMEQSEFIEDVEFNGQITKTKDGRERFRIKAQVKNKA